jgi:hypothetical protein
MPSYAIPENELNHLISISFPFSLDLYQVPFKIIQNHPSLSAAPRVPWSQVANVPSPCAADSCWEISIDFLESCGTLPQYILGPRPKIKYVKICENQLK